MQKQSLTQLVQRVLCQEWNRRLCPVKRTMTKTLLLVMKKVTVTCYLCKAFLTFYYNSTLIF